MENKRVLLCLAHMSGKEIDFINEAFADNWVVPLGPNVDGFEKDLEKYLEEPHPHPLPPVGGEKRTEPENESQSQTQNETHPLPLPQVGATYEILKESSRLMRKAPTQAEEVLWQHLRNDQTGVRFRRQQVIGNYIVDFVSLKSKLVIEVDGGYHNEADQQEYDNLRSEYLNSIGFRVLRFTNEEVIHDIDRVIDTIAKNLESPLPEALTTSPTNSSPLPQGGGAGGGVHVSALSSGTAAVHLALVALGVGPGDEVMVQSFTFCASSHPVTYVGATPVFVDSEPDTWNMDPQLLDKAIADRIKVTGRKPKAIVVVHLYGMPAKMDEINAVAKKYDIPVVEDAAEALGSEYDGRKCGTLGHFGVLSFNGNKMITTSGGGALVCHSHEEQKEIMFLATQARENYPYYQHETIGYNYRMSNICAGIGRGQMTILEEHIAHHRHVQALYEELLKDTPGITVHRNPSEKFDSNYWLSTITLDPDLKVRNDGNIEAAQDPKSPVGGVAAVAHEAKSAHTDCEPNANVEALRRVLDAANIESRPLWKPMHLQPVYSASPAYVNGVSEDLFNRGLCLPAGPWVTDTDVRRIVTLIQTALS